MDIDPTELEMIRFRAEIEHEDDKRRVTSRVGYYLVDDWRTTLVHCLQVVAVVQVLILFGVIFAGGLPRGAVNDPRSLLLFLPMAAIPIVPFLILKLRYALRVLAVLVFIGALCWLGVMAQDWIVEKIT